MIAIDDLHKSYRTADGRLSAVLKGLSLQVPERSITAVVGPSGAGKSTLARCISLLEQPDSGSIRINGKDLSALSGEALRRERRAIGTVFQSSALLSRRTAWENVALPLAWLGVVERDIKARVGELLESVGLGHKADAWPAQLSGGQRQRIGIARALALRPSVLLADEATSGLDPQATASVLALLKRLRDEYQLAIVLITHEMDAVRTAADAVAEIRDGTIVQYGRIEDLLARPDSLLGQQLLPLTPAAAAACSTPTTPASTIISASDALPEARWIACRVGSTRLAMALTGQSFCGASARRAPLAPPRLSPPRKVEADAQATETSSLTDRPAPAMALFRLAISSALG